MPSSPTYSSKPLDASSSPHLLTLVEGALEEELGLRDLSRQLLHGGGALSSATKLVLPPLSVGEMTLRLYGALSYSQNSARDLRCQLNGA